MRRAAALRRLSSEHHTGLAAARRARKLAGADTAERAAGWADLQRRFVAELEALHEQAPAPGCPSDLQGDAGG